MQKIMVRLRWIHYFLAGLMLWQMGPIVALAQLEHDNRRIENVRVQINGQSSVYIDYDLLGPTDQVFKVSIEMKRESDSTFSYVPQNVAGDVGSNVFPGRNNRIVWSIAKEFPEGIKEGEFYFVFTVEGDQVSAGGISSTVLIVGGAALLGGILALLLIAKKEDGPPTTNLNNFPAPPSRPSGAP